MDILYIGMRHEYGDPSRGLSFEENNFRSSLEGMGHRLTVFDFMDREAQVGRAAMRNELIAIADEVKPELAFFFLFTDQIDAATIEAVGNQGDVPRSTGSRMTTGALRASPATSPPLSTSP